MSVPETEIAWAAGFYDGEGCATLYRKKGNAAVRLIVVQRERELLERFQDAVGGLGKFYYNARVRYPIWQWHAGREPEAREVLRILWPYLGRIKREQAERALSQSTWHDGHANQLLCKDPTHKVVPRKGGGRRCQTCANEYLRAWRKARA